ncbi:SMEK domain-containing protein [Citrobacter freundii]|uniref:SMEK domain-containing protein n=1 Tax=Citrobacter freundii TaxID=546 RepID=UPI0023B1AA20|nr:SMEK domain-containing protein [Citrobacter freundii]
MKPEQMKNREELVKFATILAYQIKLSTRSNLNDISTSQERSLLPLINRAWGENFVDMNKHSQNYPGLDYAQPGKRLGLQMTATVTKQKYQKTLKKLREREELKGKFDEVWFFVLIAGSLPDNVRENPSDFRCKYYTLHDLVEKVMEQPLQFQYDFLALAKQEYSDYFLTTGATANQGYSVSENQPIPSDLELFNALIETEAWFDDVAEGKQIVFDFLENFRKTLRQCNSLARNLLSKIISEIDVPENTNAKMKFPEKQLFGPLNIDKTNYEEFSKALDDLHEIGLIERWDDYVGMYEVGEDIHIKNNRMISVHYNKTCPEMNLYAALYLFYKKYNDIEDLVSAIENHDFSLLADSACKNT